ncbi:MAG: formate dehydrogenase subunit alpha [Planctomycetota bacterium]
MVKIILNGEQVETEPSKTILQVAIEHGIQIPRLCHYEELIPAGRCRLCLVEIKSANLTKLVSSCNYKVEEGLEIFTDSPQVIEARKAVMNFLFSLSPSSTILQEYAQRIGIKIDEARVGNEDCIYCGLCVRICEQIMEKNVIGFINKGEQLQIAPLFREDYASICRKCGACIFTCPTIKIRAECLNPDESIIQNRQTERLKNLRLYFLKILAKDYPRDFIRKYPQKLFHRFLIEYGLEAECRGIKKKNLIDDSHPYIYVDMSRCIGCQTCLRVCNELQGQFVWKIKKVKNKILPKPDGRNLYESSCVSCGACADACPTGAIEDRTIIKYGEPERFIKTTCVYCGVGCELNVGVKDNKIVTIKPSYESPVNRGHLCVKGRYAYTYINSRDRIKTPLIRDGKVWKEIDLEKALKLIARKFEEIKREYGPDAISVLGSSRATNEENYLTQKFARIVIGTNNVDCCARVCHAPTAAALNMMLGTGAATNSFEDIEMAKTILVAGANPTENHPVIGARIKQRVFKGANLIVIDPRKTELGEIATVFLPVAAGTDIPLFNAFCYTIIDEKLYDEKFISERTNGFEELREFLHDYTPEKVAKICKVNPELIKEAARLYAVHKPSYAISGLGLSEHKSGTENVCALINLALLTGNIGKRGTGINPLRGQNNVQGAAHMGCIPTKLTGFVDIKKGKELFESVWKTKIPEQKGLDAIELIDAILNNRIKALYLIGWDLLLTHPQADKTLQALKNLEFLVIQDPFFNKTAHEVGNVFLPCTVSFEKEGTFMNAERRINKVNKVIEPPPRIKTDWEIICLLAKEMGYEEYFRYKNAEEIWEEIRKVWKAGEGITYKTLTERGIQWPATQECPDGTPVLHKESFPIVGKATFKCIKYDTEQDKSNDEYSFKLITGRTLHQFNAGTFIVRTANIKFYPSDFLLISPEDAKKLNLKNMDKVKVKSKFGEIVTKIKLSKKIKKGELFLTFHYPEIFTNKLTGYENCDTYTHTPQYKLTYVSLEKVATKR